MDTLKQVTTIFREVFEDLSLEIEKTTSAKDIKSWNSLNHIILIAEIEKKFNITFELDDMILFKNVGDIIQAIDTKIA